MQANGQILDDLAHGINDGEDSEDSQELFAQRLTMNNKNND